MTKIFIRSLNVFTISLLLVFLPVMAPAQTGQAKAVSPPISQPLVTEGTLAVSLVAALGVSSTTDEIEAESNLGEIGIVPRNGWIADYPVTPDIVAEVRQSVATAADNKQLSLPRDEAVKRFTDTIAGLDLSVRSYTGSEPISDQPVSCENYPNPAMVNNTYSTEGPPIVTYYCPPPDYYYQYDWVPYPFWWTDFWFPGFFILRDFDRHVFVHNHFKRFSNHFNDIRRNHLFRIDPVERFHGRTFAGIGVRQSRGFISTGVQHSPQTIFNAQRGFNASRGAGVPSMRSGPGSGGGMHSGVGTTMNSGSSGSMHGGGGGGMHGGGGGGMHGGGGGGMHGGGGGGGRR
jgi:hypothetical protein